MSGWIDYNIDDTLESFNNRLITPVLQALCDALEEKYLAIPLSIGFGWQPSSFRARFHEELQAIIGYYSVNSSDDTQPYYIQWRNFFINNGFYTEENVNEAMESVTNNSINTTLLFARKYGVNGIPNIFLGEFAKDVYDLLNTMTNINNNYADYHMHYKLIIGSEESGPFDLPYDMTSQGRYFPLYGCNGRTRIQNSAGSGWYKHHTEIISVEDPDDYGYPSYAVEVFDGFNDGPYVYLNYVSQIPVISSSIKLIFNNPTYNSARQFKYILEGSYDHDILTSGLLIVGYNYSITTYIEGDDFVNVGGSNATGTTFIATGTTPSVWTQKSKIICIGKNTTSSTISTIEEVDGKKLYVKHEQDYTVLINGPSYIATCELNQNEITITTELTVTPTYNNNDSSLPPSIIGNPKIYMIPNTTWSKYAYSRATIPSIWPMPPWLAEDSGGIYLRNGHIYNWYADGADCGYSYGHAYGSSKILLYVKPIFDFKKPEEV